MTENIETFESAGLNRRSVVKAAAWSAPVIATAVATPLAAASGDPEPLEAESIALTASNVPVNRVGYLRVFGLDEDGDEGVLPANQEFIITSDDLDFDSIVTRIEGGTIENLGNGQWRLIPNSGATSLAIRISSPTPGSYEVVSMGPIGVGDRATGQIREA